MSRLYYSRRGIPLVYSGVPDDDRPVLTVENHPKWYGFCLVRRDGSVEDVNFGVLLDRADELDVRPYADHVPNAELVPHVASEEGWRLDPCSYEMMVGRWVSEVLEPTKYDY